MKIGFVDDTLWQFVDSICTVDPFLVAQQRDDYKHIKSKLQESGAIVHVDVPFSSTDDLNYKGEDALEQLWSKDSLLVLQTQLTDYRSRFCRTMGQVYRVL